MRFERVDRAEYVFRHHRSTLALALLHDGGVSCVCGVVVSAIVWDGKGGGSEEWEKGKEVCSFHCLLCLFILGAGEVSLIVGMFK